MRVTLACAYALAALAVASPSFAQDTSSPPPAAPSQAAPSGTPSTLPAQPQAETSRKAAIRACMATHKQAIRKQVATHMRGWQSANPDASADAIAAERTSFRRSVAHRYVRECRTQISAPPAQQ